MKEKQDLIREWLWRMKIIDGNKVERLLTIKDYSDLLFIIDRIDRNSKKEEQERILKIIDEWFSKHWIYFADDNLTFFKEGYVLRRIDELKEEIKEKQK